MIVTGDLQCDLDVGETNGLLDLLKDQKLYCK